MMTDFCITGERKATWGVCFPIGAKRTALTRGVVFTILCAHIVLHPPAQLDIEFLSTPYNWTKTGPVHLEELRHIVETSAGR